MLRFILRPTGQLGETRFMLREIDVQLDNLTAVAKTAEDTNLYGKALAVRRVIGSEEPDRTIFFTGYTPITASGLGFAGKLNVYGVSLLGNNLQGSRSGGLIARYLTRLGLLGVRVVGETDEPVVLHIDADGEPHLEPLKTYGDDFAGAFNLAEALYEKLGRNIGLAVTDPSTTGFAYNAIACNAKPGEAPHRVAGRSTSRFGHNGLVGIAVEPAAEPKHGLSLDRRKVAEILRRVHQSKWNKNLTGNNDPNQPLLGGTYGAAAKTRFDQGYGLTNLFRGADVPDEFYQALLPENIAQEQLRLAEAGGLTLTRYSCLPGCPNKCSQVIVLQDARGSRIVKAGEWETYQGAINLGIFEEAVSFAAWITGHSNNHAYDHIEALVTLAALALVSETKGDTGVRYGDAASCRQALIEAVEGNTDLGRLVRAGAAAVERHYGIERHFTVGGHALPFHNGRSMLQTGVGLSWAYGRHGEVCAGVGRCNFLGRPYDPTDHSLAPETHVLNTIHGMVLFGAVDEMGICFFIGPNVDTLVDARMILAAMNLPADPRQMIRESAETIRAVHRFNASRGAPIRSLPEVFYREPTHGNAQTPAQAVSFNVPFEVIRDYGRQVLDDIAEGRVTISDELLETSEARYR